MQQYKSKLSGWSMSAAVAVAVVRGVVSLLSLCTPYISRNACARACDLWSGVIFTYTRLLCRHFPIQKLCSLLCLEGTTSEARQSICVRVLHEYLCVHARTHIFNWASCARPPFVLWQNVRERIRSGARDVTLLRALAYTHTPTHAHIRDPSGGGPYIATKRAPSPPSGTTNFAHSVRVTLLRASRVCVAGFSNQFSAREQKNACAYPVAITAIRYK